ncbi:MAG: Nif3-like dinuclear metal center hexameric protein [Clostridia bacterium]|nr:Nif3-like dinuclear metal center hexameric protein [Clostridia bacterium]
MVTVKKISDYINEIAPYNNQCEWDNCGLLIGNESKEVKKVGFVLDLTSETLDSALNNGVDLIITHHPVIFKPQKNFLTGNIAYEAAIKGISVISAHTCFDSAIGGVNDVLCNILGVKNISGVYSDAYPVPVARIGNIDEISSSDFAVTVSKKLKTHCRVVDCSNSIKKVAVCGGSGADFLSDVFNMGADAYVTGEMDHHEMLYAAELGITVVLAGHFETENPSMLVLKENICNNFVGVEGIVLNQKNPVKYIG